MPKEFHESPRIGDLVVYEAADRYSRETVTIPAGTGQLKIGQLLGKRAADAAHLPVDPAADDGTEAFAALLLQDIDATDAAAEAVTLVRHATVKRSGLVHGPAFTSEAEKDAAEAQMANAGILIREVA